jgi:hypothetical protein
MLVLRPIRMKRTLNWAATTYKNDVDKNTSMDACLADAACAASLEQAVSSSVIVSSSSEEILSSSLR